MNYSADKTVDAICSHNNSDNNNHTTHNLNGIDIYHTCSSNITHARSVIVLVHFGTDLGRHDKIF